jgi:hypothetical protein
LIGSAKEYALPASQFWQAGKRRGAALPIVGALNLSPD